MAWPAILAGIGATMPLIGDLIGGNQQRIQNQKARDLQLDLAKRNEKLQKDFAKHGIRWKVADAEAAGVHPLYALGAQTMSYSPQSVGVQADTSQADMYSNLGRNLGSMSQDISRAISKTQTQEERMSSALQLQSMQLDNQIKAAQLRKLELSSPSFPGVTDNYVPGQGNSGLVQLKPSEVTSSAKGRVSQEAGVSPGVAYYRTDTGLKPVIPQALAEQMEDDNLGKLDWRIRNQFLPNLPSFIRSPEKPSLDEVRKQFPGAQDSKWSRTLQEWQPVYAKPKSYKLRSDIKMKSLFK